MLGSNAKDYDALYRDFRWAVPARYNIGVDVCDRWAASEPDRLAILRRADAVYIEEIRNAGLYDAIWQAFAVLLPVRTVGVMGDGRTYDQACALRAVTSTDGMTADYYPFDHAFLGRVASRIINEVRGINRVTYDITSKPPGTIEWE